MQAAKSQPRLLSIKMCPIDTSAPSKHACAAETAVHCCTRQPASPCFPWPSPALDGVPHAVPLLIGDTVKQLAEDAQREAALHVGEGEGHHNMSSSSCSCSTEQGRAVGSYECMGASRRQQQCQAAPPPACSASAPSSPRATSPVMVCVLPAPVWPYTKMEELKPGRSKRGAGQCYWARREVTQARRQHRRLDTGTQQQVRIAPVTRQAHELATKVDRPATCASPAMQFSTI